MQRLVVSSDRGHAQLHFQMLINTPATTLVFGTVCPSSLYQCNTSFPASIGLPLTILHILIYQLILFTRNMTAQTASRSNKPSVSLTDSWNCHSSFALHLPTCGS